MQLRAATKQGDGDLVRFIREKKGSGAKEGKGEDTNYRHKLFLAICILPFETSGTASCGPFFNQKKNIYIYIYN